MTSDLVSIIIPLYNSEKYIGDCIESCLRQEYENIEVIVIDDGSTDDGLSVAKKDVQRDKRVKVFHTRNCGVSSARNTGIKKSHGKYVCFLDADDCLDKGFVGTMINYMVKYRADFCFSRNVWDIKQKNIKQMGASGRLVTSSDAEALLLSQEVAVGCWNKMYTRSILSTHLFREDLFYGEGLFFINKIAHDSSRVVVCEDALYHYRKVNPESATTAFSLAKMHNGEKSLLEIRKMISGDGKKVNRVWSQHYCLFCINAMLGILKTGEGRNEYMAWRKKLLRDVVIGLRAPGSFKTRLRLVIATISPSILLKISGRTKR